MTPNSIKVTPTKPTLIPNTFNVEGLPESVDMYDFTQIAENVDGDECVVAKLSLAQYQKLLKMMEQTQDDDNVTIKGSWTSQEDQLLLDLVEKYGPRKWSYISKYMSGRVGKQCRERYLNHLDPRINKGDWSEAEDKKILELHETHGNQWARIARFLKGRTANAVKNHWNSTLRRQLDRKLYSKHVVAEERTIKTSKKRKRESPIEETEALLPPIPTRSQKNKLTLPIEHDHTVPDAVENQVHDETKSPAKQRRKLNLAEMVPSPQNGVNILSPTFCPTPSDNPKKFNLYLEVDDLQSTKSANGIQWETPTMKTAPWSTSTRSTGEPMFNHFSPTNGLFGTSPKNTGSLISPQNGRHFNMTNHA